MVMSPVGTNLTREIHKCTASTQIPPISHKLMQTFSTMSRELENKGVVEASLAVPQQLCRITLPNFHSQILKHHPEIALNTIQE